MDRFGDAFGAFFKFELRADDWVAYVVFMGSSAVVGLAIVLLDACAAALGDEKGPRGPAFSYLGLIHGWRTTPNIVLVWVIASVIASGLALMSRIFQPTPFAAIVASLTWRTLLVQLRRLTIHHVEQRPGGE